MKAKLVGLIEFDFELMRAGCKVLIFYGNGLAI